MVLSRLVLTRNLLAGIIKELLLANKIPEFTSVRQGFLSLPKIADLNIGEKKRWDRGCFPVENRRSYVKLHEINRF